MKNKTNIKLKTPRLNITNFHKAPLQDRVTFFDELEKKFFDRLPKLKKALTFRNSKYQDIYSQKEDLIKLQFDIHRETIIKGNLSKGTRAFISNVKMLSTRNIQEMVLEKANASLEEYLDTIKAQSYEEYLEAVDLINNMSDEQKKRLVKERGFFISHVYDSQGRSDFDEYIRSGDAEYKTDTIEMYKLKYFQEHNTLRPVKQLKKMTEKRRNRSKYRI